MTIRERIEQIEADTLSPYACLSINSKGRDREEPQCDIRPVFQRDRDRILHSKSFRRLKSKTQVFLTPMGDHYRTRLTHTLEVSQNARTIAKALRLNEDLVEAIALGHDLGHTPFGHAGEFLLNQVYEGGFQTAGVSPSSLNPIWSHRPPQAVRGRAVSKAVRTEAARAAPPAVSRVRSSISSKLKFLSR